ncbi:GntR family transcriptional regulator [Paenibacillus hamazuiensis]|uniref:GntR family transcriptional regulator n=1 Tax=Paenibacillus hamazuiensis TaxID=2936508 RepID=UPI00200C6077|nr:GntR family transcriptional regulator [Paenibacillus hamazuiensis]
MDTSDESKPLYRIISDKINHDIREGKYSDHLPPQNELAIIYEVGRSTIRESLRHLEEQGIIQVRHGANTKILVSGPAYKLKPGLESFIGVSKVIEDAGFVPSTSYVNIRRAHASKLFFPDFSGMSVIVLERVRTADGKPVVFSIDVFKDEGLAIDELEAYLKSGSLLEYLKRNGSTISFAETTVRAMAADQAVSQRLHIRVGEPVLLLEEVCYDSSGNIAITSNDYYHPQLVNFRVIRRAENMK